MDHPMSRYYSSKYYQHYHMGKVISCKIIYGTKYFKVLFEQKSMADFVRMVGNAYVSKKNQSMMFLAFF